MPQNCPVCDTSNPASQRYCLKCGAPFYQAVHPDFLTTLENLEAHQRRIFSKDEHLPSLDKLRQEQARLAREEQELQQKLADVQEALRQQKTRLETALHEQRKLEDVKAFHDYSVNYHALFDSFFKEFHPPKDQPAITYTIRGQTLEVSLPPGERRKPHLMLVVSREEMKAGLDKGSQFVNLYPFLTLDASGKWVADLDRLPLPAGHYYVRLTAQHKEGRSSHVRHKEPLEQRKVDAKMLEITLR